MCINITETAEDLLQFLLDAKNSGVNLKEYKIACDEGFDVMCYTKDVELVEHHTECKELILKN